MKMLKITKRPAFSNPLPTELEMARANLEAAQAKIAAPGSRAALRPPPSQVKRMNQIRAS
jgi:hypothetical protein